MLTDRPAHVEEEIEVTPEMIEAGADELMSRYSLVAYPEGKTVFCEAVRAIYLRMWAAKRQTESDYPQPEAEQRRDALLNKLLHTPPQPRPSRNRLPAHEYIVLDGEMRVALVKERRGGEMVADVYRNLDDLRAGRPMERALALTTD
jgi:hypothetical protein